MVVPFVVRRAPVVIYMDLTELSENWVSRPGQDQGRPACCSYKSTNPSRWCPSSPLSSQHTAPICPNCVPTTQSTEKKQLSDNEYIDSRKNEKKLRNEEEFDQPVFFSSFRFPERKIKHACGVGMSIHHRLAAMMCKCLIKCHTNHRVKF